MASGFVQVYGQHGAICVAKEDQTMTPVLERSTKQSVFADVPTVTVLDSAGRRFAAPVRYEDAALIQAAFPVSADEVAKLLPSPRLKPVQFVPSMATLAIFAAEYRRVVEIQPYNEVGVMVPVLYAPHVNIPLLPALFPERFPGLAYYVYALPVTTEEARDGGIEFWGLPKFLAEIAFEDTPSIRRCSLQAEGKDILTLEVEKGPTTRTQDNTPLYSVKNGWLLKTVAQWEGEYNIRQFQGGATLTLGDHPLAETLRCLRIRSRAVYRGYAPMAEGLLPFCAEYLRI
jgi:hypothetical protein